MSDQRLVSLDQFRGYTVLAMLIVNFVGGLQAVPSGLKHHHNYCSYADTIMPQFLFAVGFGMRISFLRRKQSYGLVGAYRHFFGRCFGLMVLGILLYQLTGNFKTWAELQALPWPGYLLTLFKRGPFETLFHIAVTSVWCLPVLAGPIWLRMLWAVFSGVAHVMLSLEGYYQWNLTNPRGVDGGPLGFLTWTIPLILGTITHDWLSSGLNRRTRMLGVGAILMTVAVSLSYGHRFVEPVNGDWSMLAATWSESLPFTGKPDNLLLNYWIMSQRAGSVTYPLFAAGFALWVFALFQYCCDHYRFQWSLLQLFGQHALAAYIVHGMASSVVRPFTPNDSPGWWVMIAIGIYLLLNILVLRYLDQKKLYLRL